jgi:hypothetical protein
MSAFSVGRVRMESEPLWLKAPRRSRPNDIGLFMRKISQTS